MAVRPLWMGIGAIAVVGLGTLGIAGALSPTHQLSAALAGHPAPSGRLEAAAADIAVVDGSTLRLAMRVVRLFGIEAPERGQTCKSPGSVSSIDCAAAATAALAALVREQAVACEVRDSDSMGRPLAICAAGGTELNIALVAGGWARAEGGERAGGAQAADLRQAELLARAGHRGLWGEHRASSSGKAPGSPTNGREATW